MRATTRALLASLVWLAAGAIERARGDVPAGDPLLVASDSGPIRGARSERGATVRVFRGIPYAATTAGENRWKPPQPVPPWSEVRDCIAFGAACPQPPYPRDSIYYRDPEPQSEDCLSLNVWTAAADGQRRPVMVWIHGGALTRGSGAVPVYDGTRLAERGVVVVTLNYRLGPLGFFAHPELTAESPHGASGNYGLLDQIAALQWVRRNISRFGGDPECVTIFGESAGSLSVCALLASPLTKGLVHRAIGQSGAAFRPMQRLAAAERQGAALARAAEAQSLSALRALPAERLIELSESRGDGRTSPIVDGWCLPDEVRETFAAGRQNLVPTIAGSNADEMTTLSQPSSWPATLAALRSQLALLVSSPDEVLALYGAGDDADAARAYLAIAGDMAFTLPARNWVRFTTRAGQQAFLYQFTRVAPGPLGEKLGAHHAAEIAYVFDNLDLVRRELAAEDETLADALADYWTAFARSGDPNSEGLPRWQAYEPKGEAYLELNLELRPAAHLKQQKLDMLERLIRRPPAPAGKPDQAR